MFKKFNVTKYILVITFLRAFHVHAAEPSGIESEYNRQRIEEYFRNRPNIKTHQLVRSYEGEEVVVFHPTVADWVRNKFTTETIKEIYSFLKNKLRIELTESGFPRAAEGSSYYSPVWVRDAAWIYYALKIQDPHKAKKVLLGLLRYYGTPTQRKRFLKIIANPAIGMPSNPNSFMDVPHIRFNGDDPKLDDVKICDQNGHCTEQLWNHKQNDAHAMFLSALYDGLKDGIICESDLTKHHLETIALFIPYFKAIDYTTFPDAGAWEELDRINSSSIGLVAASIMQWSSLISEPRNETLNKRLHSAFDEICNINKKWKDSWNLEELRHLANRGKASVKMQLDLGGESPTHDPYKEQHLFRNADIALHHLVLPGHNNSLYGNDPEMITKIIHMVNTLKRPAGYIRYEGDTYQSGNYWIKTHRNHPGYDGTSLPPWDETNGLIKKVHFLGRFFTPTIEESEQQWFFDSAVAGMYQRLWELTPNSKTELKIRYKRNAIAHLKRALGQLTGPHLYGDKNAPMIAANGKPLDAWLAPEGIDQVHLNGRKYYLPTPIAPLNWAKASLFITLHQMTLESSPNI